MGTLFFVSIIGESTEWYGSGKGVVRGKVTTRYVLLFQKYILLLAYVHFFLYLCALFYAVDSL